MSMPNIPDILPDMSDISRDDALNILLLSIAFTKVSLSNIMDAEREKIRYVMSLQGENNPSEDELAEINRSVEQVIKNAGRYEMLLLQKLEDVLFIMPPEASTVKVTEGSTTAGIGYYTINEELLGTVRNRYDAFYGGKASVNMDIYSNDGIAKGSVAYTVSREGCTKTLAAFPASLQVSFVNQADLHPDMIVVKGEGIIEKITHGGEIAIGTGTFTLTLADKGSGTKHHIVMVIESANPALCHNSGKVSKE